LRFVLDEDLDARIVRAIESVQSGSHQCWTVPNAGLNSANDDDVSVYAHDRKAVLISHDQALIHRRQISNFGLLIWLKCDEPDGVAIIKKHLPEIIRLLNRRQNMILKVTALGVTVMPPVHTAR
jgi:predicted nuclease of predicted toxin-antitoxin system